MSPVQKKRILYFIKGIGPTAEEVEAAAKIPTLTFRSVQSYSDGDFIEPCDGVAGCAPAAYVKKFPKVDEVKVQHAPEVKVKSSPSPPPPVVSTPPAPPVVSTPPPPPPPQAPWNSNSGS